MCKERKERWQINVLFIILILRFGLQATAVGCSKTRAENTEWGMIGPINIAGDIILRSARIITIAVIWGPRVQDVF